MKTNVDARLRKLEAAKPEKGWRYFTQDLDDPSIFWETPQAKKPSEFTAYGFDAKNHAIGLPLSKAEIDALSDEGWHCMVLAWARGDEWRAGADSHVVEMEW